MCVCVCVCVCMYVCICMCVCEGVRLAGGSHCCEHLQSLSFLIYKVELRFHLWRKSGRTEFLSLKGLSLPSVQFSHSVVSNSLRSHELQHTRLSCPSPVPGACSN